MNAGLDRVTCQEGVETYTRPTVCVCVKITHGLKEDVKRSEEERARFVGTMRLTRGEVFGLSGKQRPNP